MNTQPRPLRKGDPITVRASNRNTAVHSVHPRTASFRAVGHSQPFRFADEYHPETNPAGKWARPDKKERFTP